MATIRAVTGRHLTIELDAYARNLPDALKSLQCSILDKPGGTQLLTRTMTLVSTGVYVADFTSTQTAALVTDAAFEICQFDPNGDPTDLTPLIAGVVQVCRPGDASGPILTNRLTVDA